jgi:hypothetical protein
VDGEWSRTALGYGASRPRFDKLGDSYRSTLDLAENLD